MKRVLLIDIYSHEKYSLSLALGCLKAYSVQSHEIRDAYEIEILSFSRKIHPEEIVAAIKRRDPFLVGFSCFNWNMEIVGQVLRAARWGKKPVVVLGGVEVTPFPEAVLQRNPQADLVVGGEGEKTFREILERLKEESRSFNPETLLGIKGISFRDSSRIRNNPPRDPIERLDDIPSPYIHEVYEQIPGDCHVLVETARGCLFHCAYCFENRGFRKLRSFSLERVKEEITYLLRKGVRDIEFIDTNFNAQRDRALEILRFLRKKGKRANYYFEIRAELLDKDLIGALSSLRFSCEIGLQTTNEKALQAVNRVLDGEKFKTQVEELLRKSIYSPNSYTRRGGVTIDLMLGLPGDRVRDVLASFDFAFSLHPSRILAGMTKILPGTVLHREAKKLRLVFEPRNLYEVTASQGINRREMRSLRLFRDAIEILYNRSHLVRTVSYLSSAMQIPPSGVFMEFGRHLEAHPELQGEEGEKRAGKSILPFMDEFCRKNKRPELYSSVSRKIVVELILNRIQAFQENHPGILGRAVSRGAGKLIGFFF